MKLSICSFYNDKEDASSVLFVVIVTFTEGLEWGLIVDTYEEFLSPNLARQVYETFCYCVEFCIVYIANVCQVTTPFVVG